MIDTLREICALQPSYSWINTPAMKRRGELIRRLLPEEIRQSEDEIRAALGEFEDDFDIEGSDGIGRKTEAPWVRFYARSMSPSAREGYYVVIHFAADGSAVYITVGCGSTTWANGDLKPVSDDELKRRTEWAREIIEHRFGSMLPFADEIALGAKAALPRTFEKATAVAKRIAVQDLDEELFRSLLVDAAKRLRTLYQSQQIGGDLSASNAAEVEVEAISRPTRVLASGQGFRLSAVDRIAIEMRAMQVARGWLESQGFSVTDRSKTSPFDFEAANGEADFKIEVKGTTAATDDAIFMTKNEVELHTSEMGKTGLIIVSGIQLEKVDGKSVATGGNIYAELGWNIGSWDRIPMAYRLTRPKP
jgi:hypothetical protein